MKILALHSDYITFEPTKKALKELYDALAPEGILVVHDCDPKVVAWKGAYKAYTEFMDEINKPVHIINSLGIVRK